MVVTNKYMISLVLQILIIYNSIVSLLTQDKKVMHLIILRLLNLVRRRMKTHTTLSKSGTQKIIQSFIDYNIVDVELVDQLEDKMKLLELCLTMVSMKRKVNYEDVFGQVKYWDVLIHNYLKNKKIVIHKSLVLLSQKSLKVHM